MRYCLKLVLLLGLTTLCLPHLLWEQPLPSSDVNVRIDENRASHILYRKNLVAAHLSLLSGVNPRVLAAFPAANSGVAIWLQSPKGETKLDWITPPHTSRGLGSLQAVSFEISANQDELVLTQAVLGSVRFIRDWDIDRIKPSEIQEQVEFTSADEVTLHRKSLDGQAYYRVTIKVVGGVARQLADGHVAFASARAGETLRLDVTTVSSEHALTPIPPDHLLKPEIIASTDDRSIQLFSFLMYKEKFLAGSWTYLTYFGRDTLLTLRFLMNALQPEAIESMLGAVIDRVRDDGDVAHEEEIGDYASFRASRKGEGFKSEPRYDYRMVDDDFLLTPVLMNYVRDAEPARLTTFLSRQTPGGRTYRQAILSNIDLVERRAEAFARDPRWHNLISFPSGQPEGNWRDSHPGVGWGRFAYDVNAALVPAALTAARTLLSRPEFSARDEGRLATLLAAAQVWNAEAPRLFHVHVARDAGEAQAERYMRTQSLLMPPAPGRAVDFNGISLDDHGKIVPVMHSDEGFLMMFGDPPEDTLLHIADILIAPFPFGLRSDVGLLVANPAFSDEKMQSYFTPQHYHGVVTWSWQQAMMAAALRRQVERADISKLTRRKLELAETRVWDVITRTEKYRSAELWTWHPERGTMAYTPFGQNAGDHSESNPNQGWSHAFIGVRPPPNLGHSDLARVN